MVYTLPVSFTQLHIKTIIIIVIAVVLFDNCIIFRCPAVPLFIKLLIGIWAAPNTSF